MSILSAETRRLLDLSRDGDDPTPLREDAVRNRLIARLGVTALAGVATASAVLGAAEAAGAAGSGALAGGAHSSAVVGSATAKAISTGVTTATLAKTVAGLVLVAGLGAGAWKSDEGVEQVVGWPAAVAVRSTQVVARAWHLLVGDRDDADGKRAVAPPIGSSIANDTKRHELLIAIARRPDHPVAKEAELVLILGAEKALAAGDVESAARYLDEHEARFAGGPLRDNREALRVLVDRARSAGERGQPIAPSPIAPPNAD
jgi:hypothetical protein